MFCQRSSVAMVRRSGSPLSEEARKLAGRPNCISSGVTLSHRKTPTAESVLMGSNRAPGEKAALWTHGRLPPVSAALRQGPGPVPARVSALILHRSTATVIITAES